MQVTVIIPMYNAAGMLPEAIQSALAQREVAEILLIDDGSRDQSLQVALMYGRNQPARIRVLRHQDRGNHGAAATRNLGLTHASYPYIAFLDADDIYLNNRFSATSRLFDLHPEADGIFETVETRSTDPAITVRALQSAGPRYANVAPGCPESLFSRIVKCEGGYIHLNGLVVKKSAIDDSLFFDPSLRQCQDTDFIMRWAASRRLYGGDPEHIVAVRRVHHHNRVFNIVEAQYYRYQCMRKCALHGFYGSNDLAANWAILNRMARASNLIQLWRRTRLPVTPVRLLYLLVFLLRHPRVLSILITNLKTPDRRP